MPKFGFCGPSYTSQSLNSDAQELINWYYEPDETGKGNSEGFLYPSPGEKVFVNLSATPPSSSSIVAIFQQTGGGVGSVVIPLSPNVGDAMLLSIATTGNHGITTSDNFGGFGNEQEARLDANGSTSAVYYPIAASGGGFQITVSFSGGGGAPAHYWISLVIVRDTSGTAPVPSVGLSTPYSGTGLVGSNPVTATVPGALLVELGGTMIQGLVSPSDSSVIAVTTGLVNSGSTAISVLTPSVSGNYTAQWNNAWFLESVPANAGCVVIACFQGT
jgi:hypothetical protein